MPSKRREASRIELREQERLAFIRLDRPDGPYPSCVTKDIITVRRLILTSLENKGITEESARAQLDELAKTI